MTKFNLIILITSLTLISCKICPPQETILPCQCLLKHNQYQIWCSHSDLSRVLDGLKAIGQFIPEPIDELILENNLLPSLPGRVFASLKIKRLMLRHNSLERVSSDWLSGLEKHLMEIFLVEPDLRSLPDDSLIRLHTLEAFTLQTNLLKRLPLLSGLPKLRHLQIESLSLLELNPRNLKDLPELHEIHISNSPRLIRLEGGLFQDLPRLLLVNITYCGINWIHPRAITMLPKLKQLSLVGNKIDDAGMVGRGSRDLPSLEILQLDHNYIGQIEEATFVDLPKLQKISLANNHITELKYGAFHRVPLLRTLDLSNNNVRRVHPESFLQHSGSGLEELFLVNNDINDVIELRSLLDALPRLTFLDLTFNKLEEIPFGSIRGHPTLESLFLDYNKINVIDREAFMAMPALRELRLKNNSLSELLDGPLMNLPGLKGLDLSGNFYRTFKPRFLANIPDLRRIDLSQNELSLMDPETFIMTQELEHINLSRNALITLHPATFRHLLKLYELDVSYNRLVEFVPGLPRGIEYLHMAHNQINAIPSIPSPDLDLPNLKLIDLSNNEIQQIPHNSFRTLPQLRRLYLRKNSIQHLEERSLQGLSRLEVLDLQDNGIVSISPVALNELRVLNLKNNRLNVLFPDIFVNMPKLKKLDISRNQLTEMPDTLKNNREIQTIDASHNSFVQLPPSLYGLESLQHLDLTNNRLKRLQPDILNSLSGLEELKMTRNFIQELNKGIFDNLQNLKVLNLDFNDLEMIETNAINSLPALEMIKLNNNKLKVLPRGAFSDLPALLVAELQQNQLRKIANDAFHSVPQLIVLNLSHNAFPDLDETGLKNLKSLEMLDLSHNDISRISKRSLEEMDFLVELRMDDNQICGIQESPFNEMPRLRVLTLKNNKLMTFPEESLQKIRSNIAILDLDGNPLVCSCGLLWLQAWLQEESSLGPKCIDGALLREKRLSRQDCLEEKNENFLAPGCDSELLSSSGDYAQIFNQWIKNNTVKNKIKTNNKNNLAPLPEESEYFYDEYVDYPYNETSKEPLKSVPKLPTKSPHFTTGDTPTFYAASKNKTIPKEVVNSPSTSGFTFFGVPLPSINLNKFWGSTARKTGKPSIQPTSAQRKTAIVNSLPKNRIGLPPPDLPSIPEIEIGGFQPLLPGTGGFKPIPNPNPPQIEVTTQPQNDVTTATQAKAHPLPTPTPTALITTEPAQIQTTKREKPNETTVIAKIQEITTPTPTPTPNLDYYDEIVVNTTLATLKTTENPLETMPKNDEITEKKPPTPISTLLVPAAQQTQFHSPGKSIITKIPSPHITNSAPLLSSLDVAEISNPLPHREAKTTKETNKSSTENDISWYFANYNKTEQDNTFTGKGLRNLGNWLLILSCISLVFN